MVTFGSEQYVWHSAGSESHAEPDNPPVASKIMAGRGSSDAAQMFCHRAARQGSGPGVKSTDSLGEGVKTAGVGLVRYLCRSGASNAAMALPTPSALGQA